MLSPSIMHPITATHDWIAGHPVGSMVLTFFFGSLLSIYASEVKSFIHNWPSRQYRSGVRTNSYERLALLQLLHENTYRLLLYLAGTVTGSVNIALAMYCISTISSLWQAHGFPHPDWDFYAGIWVVRLYSASIVIWQLQNYDVAVAQLKRKIAKSEAKLALKQPSSVDSPSGK